MTEHQDDGMSSGLQFTVFDATIRGLLQAGGINEDGLNHLRHHIKGGTWSGLHPVYEARRQLLLADVTTMLSVHNGMPLSYYRGQGDIPEDAPDDISGLEQ